jgi:lipoprotein NlpI
MKPACLVVVLLATTLVGPSAEADALADIDACHAAANNGELEAAIALCTRAIEADDLSAANMAIALSNRGAIYIDVGRLDLAIQDFDAAIAIQPDAAASYVNRGNAYDIQGDYGRALDDYNQAISLQPELASAYLNRGVTYGNQENLDLELKDLDRAIQLDPDYATAYSNRAGVYYHLGEIDRSIEDYSKSIRLDPSSPVAIISRGVAYYYQSSYALADSDFKVAATDPGFRAYAEIWQSLVQRRMHPDDRAAPVFSADASGWPGPVGLYYQGRIGRQEVLDSAGDPDPQVSRGQRCEAAFYLAEWDLLNGNAELARRGFEDAIANCPSSYIERSSSALGLKRL